MKLPLIIGIIALVIVLAVGMASTEFITYLGDDPTPATTAMSWTACTRAGYHAGHQAAANCTDCHVPHSSILPSITSRRCPDSTMCGTSPSAASRSRFAPNPQRTKSSRKTASAATARPYPRWRTGKWTPGATASSVTAMWRTASAAFPSCPIRTKASTTPNPFNCTRRINSP